MTIISMKNTIYLGLYSNAVFNSITSFNLFVVKHILLCFTIPKNIVFKNKVAIEYIP